MLALLVLVGSLTGIAHGEPAPADEAMAADAWAMDDAPQAQEGMEAAESIAGVEWPRPEVSDLALTEVAPVEAPMEAPVMGESATDLPLADVVAIPEDALPPDTASSPAQVQLAEAEGFVLGSAQAGDRLSLAIPMTFAVDGWKSASNLGAEGGIVPYDPTVPMAFDQSAAGSIAWATLRMDTAVNDPAQSPLASDGSFVPEAPLVDALGNCGYAVFSGLYIPQDTAAGSYTLWFTARWLSAGGVQEQSHTFALTLQVGGEWTAPVGEAGDGEMGTPAEDAMPESFDPTSILHLLEETESADAADIAAEADESAQRDGEADAPSDEQPELPPGDDVPAESMPAESSDAPIIVAQSMEPVVSGVALEETAFDAVKEGESLTLPVAVNVSLDGGTWQSNAGPDGEEIAYGEGGFAQDVPEGIAELFITLDAVQFAQEDFPFELQEGASLSQPVIASGVNHGYAAFSGLKVRTGATPGDHSVAYVITWRPTAIDASAMAAEDESPAEAVPAPDAPQQSTDEAAPEAPPSSSPEEAEGFDLLALLGIGRAFAEGSEAIPDAPTAEYTIETEQIVQLNQIIGGRNVPDGWRFSDATPTSDSYLVLAEGEGADTTCIIFSPEQMKKAFTAKMRVIYFGTSTDANTASGGVYDGQPVNDGVFTYSTIYNTSIQIADDGAVVVMDGMDPMGQSATPMKVIDRQADGTINTIYVTGTGAKLTMQNFIWESKNVYGMAELYAGDGMLHLKNIKYTGTQIAYAHRSGDSLTLEACDITIATYNLRTPEEIAQVNGSIRITGGTTTIDVSSTTYGYFGNANSDFVFTVDADATLEVTSNKYLFYTTVKELNIAGKMIANITDTTGFGSTITTANITGELTLNHAGTGVAMNATTMNVSGLAQINYINTGGGGNAFTPTTLNILDQGRVAVQYITGTSGGVGINATTITVQPGGALSLQYSPSTTGGVGLNATTLDVQDGASCAIVYAPGSTGAAAITPNTLKVGEGADFMLVRKPGNANANNAITASTGAYFTNPKRAYVYNNNGLLISTNPKTITTSALNLWDSGAPDPSIGGSITAANPPPKVWQNEDLGAFTYAAGTVSDLQNSGKGFAPNAVALSAVNLDVTNARNATRLLAMGTHGGVTVDPVYYRERTVSGRSGGESAIGYQYAVDEDLAPLTETSGVAKAPLRTTDAGGGGFTLSVAGGDTWEQALSMVYVLAAEDGLFAYGRTASPLVGKLTLDSVPDLVFEEMGVIGVPVLRMRVEGPDAAVCCTDLRGAYDAQGVWQPEAYQLVVRQISSFVAQEDPSDVLTGGLVYVDVDDHTPLTGESDVLAFAGETPEGGGTMNLSWDALEGIHFLQQPGEGVPGRTYTAEILWTLVPAMVEEVP